MPIYEYECEQHGKFEVIFKNYDVARTYENSHPCTSEEHCIGLHCPRIYSIPAMHPDKYWSGRMVVGEYVTSNKEAKELTKNHVPATRENIEYSQKQLPIRRKELADKRDKKKEEFFAKELASA